MSERRGAVTGHVFLYGLLFCTVFHRTGKLAPSMILDGMINLVLTLLGQLAIGV
jgi:membrane protease YdiL (CAAX protease family)